MNNLTFKTTLPSKISLKKVGNPKTINLSYIKKNDTKWTKLNLETVIELDSNDTVAFSGINEHFSEDCDNFYCFKTFGDNLTVEGNILSLVGTLDIKNNNQFNRLFEETNINNIDNLQLPSSNLTKECYRKLFANCEYLYEIPSGLLPATKLANGCYKEMFEGCKSLINIPDLPATKLVNSCYEKMFKNCQNLNSINLSATTLAPKSVREMFEGCLKLNSIEVNFSIWDENYLATENWLYSIKKCPIFIKNKKLKTKFGNNYIPENSLIIEKD